LSTALHLSLDRQKLRKVQLHSHSTDWTLSKKQQMFVLVCSQSPFHQRYAHYKQYGFAGKGASSSWARNPKYAQL